MISERGPNIDMHHRVRLSSTRPRPDVTVPVIHAQVFPYLSTDFLIWCPANHLPMFQNDENFDAACRKALSEWAMLEDAPARAAG
jgi:hypothetical protein